jgi:hypothetical protein
MKTDLRERAQRAALLFFVEAFAVNVLKAGAQRMGVRWLPGTQI